MQRSLVWKSLFVVGISLVLLLPLLMIEGQISARKERQIEVVRDISESSAGPQQVVGPLLVLTWIEHVPVEVRSDKGEVHKELHDEPRARFVAPRELDIRGHVDVQERHRSLYKAQVFDLDAAVSGDFKVPAYCGASGANAVTPGRAYVTLDVTDMRGFRVPPVIAWNGAKLDFQQGKVPGAVEHGIHADLAPIPCDRETAFHFDLPLKLIGSEALSIAPVGESTHAALTSNWRAPSFHGRFLPADRKIDDNGFEATWQVSYLARSLDRILAQQADESFGVSFVDPVNVYLMSERAVKYGFLFVGLTFWSFFLFEMTKRLRIHPVQYCLVGAALALFFLLLISLSEHIPFRWAYATASTGCILLLGVYLTHTLRSALRAASFAGGLTLLYGSLYLLLLSEDYALVIGSGLLFVLLAAVMLGTRKLDWYELASIRAPAPALQPVPVEPR